MFIILSIDEGLPIAVNVKNIDYFEPPLIASGKTHIKMSGGCDVFVTETFDHIKTLLRIDSSLDAIGKLLNT